MKKKSMVMSLAAAMTFAGLATTGPASAGPVPGAARPAAAVAAGRVVPAPYQPLWPFLTAKQVRAWQRAYASGGHSPWHLSADESALGFVQGYLGFDELDRVYTRKIKGSHARIGVGRSGEGGRPAAIVHLVKAGSGKHRPWEVVGTDDTTFSLKKPAYGARVKSPVTVGGRITGVDESIHVQIRRPGSGAPVGDRCCVPAGGKNTPWSASLRFTSLKGEVATVVAWTGGHVAEVERFTVTAVRP